MYCRKFVSLNFSHEFMRKLVKNCTSTMSKVFKYKTNTITGTAEWQVESEDYDFYQEIARSGYADMLHDHERNVLYHKALKKVVGEMKQIKTDVHVVDIGTGTGLLAMMAAKAGADRVTAIEAFEPIAITARTIIELNGFSDKIKIISKRSTDFREEDVEDKADIAVAEVFDTELIGEGALKTFLEAHKHLLRKPSRVIPARGTIFIQVIQSDFALKWEKPANVVLPDYQVDVQVPDECMSCTGTAAVHDVQLNQLSKGDFIPITDPLPIFSFNFENPEEMTFKENKTVELTIKALSDSQASKVDAVMMWWDLDMDGSGEFILSMKPDWSNSKNVQWRDHWMQALYYLPKSISIEDKQKFLLHANHDEYSLWFSASDDSASEEFAKSENHPSCSCGLHLMFSRTNLVRFNEIDRYAQFCKAFRSNISDKRALSISDCSILPLIALQMGASQVYCLETDQTCTDIVRMYAKKNNLDVESRLIFASGVSELPFDVQFDVVFTDFFFFSSVLPWHNLHFWYVLDDLRQRGLLSKDSRVYPEKANLCCLPLKFDDLHKIRLPVGRVEGFDVTPFDDIVQAAIKTCDSDVEPHPLWEYPSTALADAQVLLEFDFSKPLPQNPSVSSVKIPLMKHVECNGVAFWMEWFYGDLKISSDLKTTCEPGSRPQWIRHQNQGVHFVQNSSQKPFAFLNVEAKFLPKSGDIFFNFNLLDE